MSSRQPKRTNNMKSNATTIDEYLSTLPPERAEQIATVREVILQNLPEGYEESMNWGMICYQVPLTTYPDTYNKQPLMYAALASQKNHMAVYLSGIYTFEENANLLNRPIRKAVSALMSVNPVSDSASWKTCPWI